MRILQTISLPTSRSSNFAGVYGGERSTTLLCRGLQERGHEICLTCRPDAPVIAHAREEGVRVMPLQVRKPRTLPIVWGLVRLARSTRAELLVGHDNRSCRLIQVAGRVLGLPSVATMRGLYNAKTYRTSARIIAVSEGVRRHIIDQGVPAEQVVTVYNGADVSRFKPPTDADAAKTKVGYQPKELVIGVTARLSEEKGHDWFFKAVAPLTAEFPLLRFLLVGDGPLLPILRERAAALNIDQATRFAGYQAEIVPWMAAMDVLVLPAIDKEGFGRVLIEAGAMGVPVIGTDVGGIGEIIVQEKTGLLVPTGDALALQGAVRRLLSDADERTSMGHMARSRVQENFSVESMVEKTEDVYRKVLI